METADLVTLSEKEVKPDEWIVCRDRSGLTFYYNACTEVSLWDLPAGALLRRPPPPPPGAAESAIDLDWAEAHDEEGDVYFWNKRTGEVTWEIPVLLDESQASAVPLVPAVLVDTVVAEEEVSDPRLIQRQRVLREIIDSEQTYVQSLEAVVELYIKPLTVTVGDPAKGAANYGLTAHECGVLFGYLETLAQLNAHFLQKLHAAVANGQSQVGPVFTDFAPFFKMYSAYAGGFDVANKLVYQLLEDDEHEEFQAFANAQRSNPLCGGNSLPSFLIMPIQRIPRYEMLLAELIKHTPADHRDLPELVSALALVGKTARHVNEYVRSQETGFDLTLLAQRFAGDVNFILPGRKFIREGTLLKRQGDGQEAKKTRLFLFSDQLVYADKNMWGKYKISQTLPLDITFDVCGVPDDKTMTFQHQFLILSAVKSIVVVATCAGDKQQWMRDCIKAKDEHTALFGKRQDPCQLPLAPVALPRWLPFTWSEIADMITRTRHDAPGSLAVASIKVMSPRVSRQSPSCQSQLTQVVRERPKKSMDWTGSSEVALLASFSSPRALAAAPLQMVSEGAVDAVHSLNKQSKALAVLGIHSSSAGGTSHRRASIINLGSVEKLQPSSDVASVAAAAKRRFSVAVACDAAPLPEGPQEPRLGASCELDDHVVEPGHSSSSSTESLQHFGMPSGTVLPESATMTALVSLGKNLSAWADSLQSLLYANTAAGAAIPDSGVSGVAAIAGTSSGEVAVGEGTGPVSTSPDKRTPPPLPALSHHHLGRPQISTAAPPFCLPPPSAGAADLDYNAPPLPLSSAVLAVTAATTSAADHIPKAQRSIASAAAAAAKMRFCPMCGQRRTNVFANDKAAPQCASCGCDF